MNPIKLAIQKARLQKLQATKAEDDAEADTGSDVDEDIEGDAGESVKGDNEESVEGDVGRGVEGAVEGTVDEVNQRVEETRIPNLDDLLLRTRSAIAASLAVRESGQRRMLRSMIGAFDQLRSSDVPLRSSDVPLRYSDLPLP
jgi:hypothetical protein